MANIVALTAVSRLLRCQRPLTTRKNDSLFIFRLKPASLSVDKIVMTVLIFLCAWTVLGLAMAVPVGRLVAVRAPR
jgi:hypothetical protein